MCRPWRWLWACEWHGRWSCLRGRSRHRGVGAAQTGAVRYLSIARGAILLELKIAKSKRIEPTKRIEKKLGEWWMVVLSFLWTSFTSFQLWNVTHESYYNLQRLQTPCFPGDAFALIHCAFAFILLSGQGVGYQQWNPVCRDPRQRDETK